MIAAGSEPQSLLKNWKSIAARVRDSQCLAIFLDFDGTLVRIAPRPEGVRLEPSTRAVLRRLIRLHEAKIFVVSGRRREELRKYIGLEGIHYLGLYGWENSAPAKLPLAARKALRDVRADLARRLEVFPGLWIEDKGESFSIHLKDVPPKLQKFSRNAAAKLIGDHQHGPLRLFQNLRDVEVVPTSVKGKGAAMRRLLNELPKGCTMPFYFGDDHSDEAAFAAIPRGVSVKVGPARPTAAKYALRGPQDVTAVLQLLERELRTRPKRRSTTRPPA